MQPFDAAINASEGGTDIAVEVTAGASGDSFPDGFNPWRNAIGCRVSAPAIGGRANRAVVAVVAGFFHVSKTRVHITSGTRGSLKRVHIEGITPKEARTLLEGDSIE